MNLNSKDDENNKKESLSRSILTVLPMPRQMVRDWGTSININNIIGPGIEGYRTPWYYYRPLFDQLWNNLYIGVGEEGPKSIQKYIIPKQHLYYLSMLLQENLLKEDYIQAGYLMIAISGSPHYVPEEIWKGGMEILKQCSSRVMSKTIHFQNLMSELCPVYSSQMALDMSFYLLKANKDILEAYQYLTSRSRNWRVKNEPLLHAYLGMFEYVLWKTDIERSLNNDKFDGEIEVDEGTDVNEMQYYAKKALENMKVILHEPGIWDVFVLKIVEIMDYYKQGDEAVSLLEEYREKNKENPNAHRYLYYYLKRHDAGSEKLFNVLKELTALDPTSELAYEYIEILKEKGLTCHVIDLLFLRLDHVACKDSLEDWELLSKYLKTYKRDSQSEEWTTLEKHLIDRKHWWPKYHFATRKKMLKQGDDYNDEATLTKFKRRVIKYYKNKDDDKNRSINHVTELTNHEALARDLANHDALTLKDESQMVSLKSKKRKRKITDCEMEMEIKRKRR